MCSHTVIRLDLHQSLFLRLFDCGGFRPQAMLFLEGVRTRVPSCRSTGSCFDIIVLQLLRGFSQRWQVLQLKLAETDLLQRQHATSKGFHASQVSVQASQHHVTHTGLLIDCHMAMLVVTMCTSDESSILQVRGTLLSSDEHLHVSGCSAWSLLNEQHTTIIASGALRKGVPSYAQLRPATPSYAQLRPATPSYAQLRPGTHSSLK
jgi:hypothetical protein